MNRDYSYCAQSHIFPRRNKCRRHLAEHPKDVALLWVDPVNKAAADFASCKQFDVKPPFALTAVN